MHCSALQECRVDYRYTNLIYNIYKNAKVTVTLHENTKCIQIGRGVRQGDTRSPKLFKTVLEYAFKKLNWENRGLNLDGRNLTNLRFADDIVLLADNLKDIKDMLQELQNACADVGLQTNISKTKYMTNLVLSKQIFIGDKEEALVNKYDYLGHEIQISRDNQTCKIKRRVTLSWAAYGKLADVFISDMPQCLKRKVFN